MQAHHNPKILDICLIGAEDDRQIKFTYVDGTVHVYDAQHLQRFVSDSLEWSLLLNDLEADRRGA